MMGKKRKKSYRKSKKKISILAVGGMLAGLAYAKRGYDAGGFSEGIRWYVSGMTGFDITEGRFDGSKLMKGAVPLVAGVVGSKVLTKFGINRALNIPYVKL